MKTGDILELTIESLGFGGEGVAKVEDFVIFVKGGLPGQVVKAVISKKKKSHAEARITEIIKRTPEEIEAKCAHFGSCGGCKWQNLLYEKQLSFKQQQVTDCLEHIAKMKTPPVLPILSSPQQFGYRNKVEFSFGYANMSIDKTDDEKWVYHDEDPTLGFHKAGKWESVVNIDHCDLISEGMNTVFTRIKEWCLSQDKDVYNQKTNQGFWRQVVMRENHKGEILLNIVTTTGEPFEFFESLRPLLVELNIQSCFLTFFDGVNSYWPDGLIQHFAGDEFIFEEVLGQTFCISPESFFQTNTKGAEVLYSEVIRLLKDVPSKSILDLYCGTGTIGQVVAGADKKKHIIGVELLESAVEDAEDNAKRNGLENVAYFAGKAEKILPEILEQFPKFDVLIIDPPRAGMHPKARKLLSEMGVKNCVYISCNPSTFARDCASFFENGYKLKSVQPVDMFPHTAHIEIVGFFERP